MGTPRSTHGTNDWSRRHGMRHLVYYLLFLSPRRDETDPVQSKSVQRTAPAGACGLLLAGPNQVAAACTADPSPPSATYPGGRAVRAGTARPPPPCCRLAANRAAQLTCLPFLPSSRSCLPAAAAEIARGFISSAELAPALPSWTISLFLCLQLQWRRSFGLVLAVGWTRSESRRSS